MLCLLRRWSSLGFCLYPSVRGKRQGGDGGRGRLPLLLVGKVVWVLTLICVTSLSLSLSPPLSCSLSVLHFISLHITHTCVHTHTNTHQGLGSGAQRRRRRFVSSPKQALSSSRQRYSRTSQDLRSLQNSQQMHHTMYLKGYTNLTSTYSSDDVTKYTSYCWSHEALLRIKLSVQTRLKSCRPKCALQQGITFNVSVTVGDCYACHPHTKLYYPLNTAARTSQITAGRVARLK